MTINYLEVCKHAFGKEAPTILATMKPEESTPEYIEELNDNGEVVCLYHTVDGSGGFKVVRSDAKVINLDESIKSRG